LGKKLNKFNGICDTIRKVFKKRCSKETQINVHKTMAIPTLKYSSETWTLTKMQRQEIEVAEEYGGIHINR
jgi:hypothetical protein